MMGLARLLIGNGVLTNLTFILVLAVGSLAYWNLPRQQDPTINFNWIVIVTAWPGASAGFERHQSSPGASSSASAAIRGRKMARR
mgnify:CR=1 FL=1